MDIAKLIFAFLIFLMVARGRSHQHFYSPMYHFSKDPVFSYIRQSQTRGVILSGYVQSLRGLNVQAVTGKQYFIPMGLKFSFHGYALNLYCYDDNFAASYPDFVKNIVTCFEKRSKEEWLLIAQGLDSNLVLTTKNIEISSLKKVASDEDFYLYEILP